jgi:hypothetical protein
MFVLEIYAAIAFGAASGFLIAALMQAGRQTEGD